MSAKKPRADSIIPSCVIEVQGPNFASMITNAKIEAATFLQTQLNNVYVVNHSVPQIASWPRFRRNLNEEVLPESWSMRVTLAAGDRDEPSSPDPDPHIEKVRT